MNLHLKSALLELKSAGAQNLPTPLAVERAANGSAWAGKKSNGDPWSLTKNKEDSYSCMC